ncbi:MAG TPA: twin-arginine translocase subunit TatC [candidate division Zixibacteria bacterium]|nr:twin-arginine translocase subunit TatC [candidate division Zixibacteria bacterium]
MSDDAALLDGQTILEHLNEFRIRLTWAAAGLVVATVICFAFAEQILAILIDPYGAQLQTLSPTEGIETYFKVALMCGAIISMPWMLYQLWLFIAPGLHENERRFVYIFVPSATFLFLIGVAFAWLVLLPAAILFLSDFMSEIFWAQWTSNEYIGFATSFLFWIGLSFELPLIFYFLSRVGVINSGTLREHWRVAIVGIAVLAALVTPSIDPVTMILTMVPLFILYGLSIVLVAIGQKQFQRSVALDMDREEVKEDEPAVYAGGTEEEE